MKLIGLLHNVDYEIVKGDINISINDICYDSRKVVNNGLFICLVGSSSDGHDYIDSAINNGAKCIIVERNVNIDNDITVIKVNDTR